MRGFVQDNCSFLCLVERCDQNLLFDIVCFILDSGSLARSLSFIFLVLLKLLEDETEVAILLLRIYLVLHRAVSEICTAIDKGVAAAVLLVEIQTLHMLHSCFLLLLLVLTGSFLHEIYIGKLL